MKSIGTSRRPTLRPLLVALVIGGALGGSAYVSPLLPPALALSGIVAAAVASGPVRPIFLLYALVVAVPLSAALPRGNVVPFLVPSEAVLLVTAVICSAYVLATRRYVAAPPILLFALGTFVLGTSVIPIAAYAYRSVSLDAGEFMALLAPVQYLILFWIAVQIPGSVRERRRLSKLMITMGAAVALVGLLQAIDFEPVVAWLASWYPTAQTAAASDVGRVTSVFGAWNALGLFLVTTLMITVATHPSEARRTHRLLMQMAGMLMLVCLLATNLWSGMIGAVIGFAFIKWRDPRGLRILVPLALALVLGTLLLLPELLQRFEFQESAGGWLPQTLAFRWEVWRDVFVPQIAEAPLWGARPSYDGLPWPHPESQYIDYLFRSGAVSLAAHVAWLLMTAAWLVKGLRHEARGTLRHGLLLTCSSLLLILSLVGFINPVFMYAGTMDYFWILLGSVVGGRSEAVHDPS